MLSTRILTAVIAIVLVLAALFALPARAFAVIVLIIMVAAALEWTRLAGFAGGARLVFVGGMVLAGLSLIFAPQAAFARGWPSAIVLAVCGAATLFWLLVATPWVILRWPTRSTLALTLCGWIVLLGAFVALVELKARSPWLVLAAMAVVWIADTAAYFTGRALGRRKLAPQVSPGKTWEGVYGALVAVALYALALVPLAGAAGYEGPRDVTAVVAWLLLVSGVTGISVVGDLFESWQKRQAGMKDSGTLLPGHGGVLDRIDALLAAMPVLALGALLALPKT
jgi:phosphatidate cytidylyltransferase